MQVVSQLGWSDIAASRPLSYNSPLALPPRDHGCIKAKVNGTAGCCTGRILG